MGRVKAALMSATMDDQFDPELHAAGQAMLATTLSDDIQPSEQTYLNKGPNYDPRDDMTREEFVELSLYEFSSAELLAELKKRIEKYEY